MNSHYKRVAIKFLISPKTEENFSNFQRHFVYTLTKSEQKRGKMSFYTKQLSINESNVHIPPDHGGKKSFYCEKKMIKGLEIPQP